MLSEIVHGVLDVAGLVPGFGEPADGINALFYAAEGDHVNAALSAAAMIPFAGVATTAGKLGGKVAKGVTKAAEKAKVALKIDSPQLGKKLGKHVEDFGGNPANAADRQMVLNKINDIANHPDKVIPGTFSGQGVGGVRGDVIFNIKGSDVVITKLDGTFVTIMKDGVNNTSVQNALKGIK